MADIAKAALRNRVLEHLSVIAAGQTPATADQTLVDEAIDAAWSRLSAIGNNLVPFPTSAIPDWAQKQLRDIVAYDVAPAYGRQDLPMLAESARRAEFDLGRQLSGRQQPRTARREYF